MEGQRCTDPVGVEEAKFEDVGVPCWAARWSVGDGGGSPMRASLLDSGVCWLHYPYCLLLLEVA